MAKNKKKSISKIIISNPISNCIDNDNAHNLEELSTPTPALDVCENNSILDESTTVHELTELVQNTIPINTVNPNKDKENIQIQSEPTDITKTIEPIEPIETIETIETIKTIETIETTVTNLVERNIILEILDTLEKTENIKDDIVLSEQEQISNNIDDKIDNIELTEIEIKNEETNSSQKKSSGCSRGWCSIL